mmetsp:Transcript_27673/g.80915  ORF Transcript_27673/g.80915 Transcript_27673/m.80915 type:complete len:106 (+) Transcript_27673:615-932(+)
MRVSREARDPLRLRVFLLPAQDSDPFLLPNRVDQQLRLCHRRPLPWRSRRGANPRFPSKNAGGWVPCDGAKEVGRTIEAEALHEKEEGKSVQRLGRSGQILKRLF